MKAIETEFRGCRFRSRTEARWWHGEGMVCDGINEARSARFEFGESPEHN